MFALTRKIDSAGPRQIRGLHFGGPPIGVGKCATLFGGRFQPASDTYAQQTLLIVMEDDPIEGVQGDYQVDDPFIVVLRKDVAGFLLQEILVSARRPYRLHDEFSSLTALGGDYFLVVNRTHLFAVGGLDRVAVIPKVEIVYVTVIEPNSCVVRMIDSLGWPRRQRKAADHIDAIRCDEWI